MSLQNTQQPVLSSHQISVIVTICLLIYCESECGLQMSICVSAGWHLVRTQWTLLMGELVVALSFERMQKSFPTDFAVRRRRPIMTIIGEFTYSITTTIHISFAAPHSRGSFCTCTDR